MNKAEMLIIDDEPQIRKLLEITLESNGYAFISRFPGKILYHIFRHGIKNKRKGTSCAKITCY